MTSRNNSSPASDSNDPQLQQEEGVLKDVLEELDRERSKRAELQALVRQLGQEKEQLAQRAAADRRPAASPSIPHRVFRSMEIQVEGYQEIIDALTLSKPAIAAAAAMEKEEATLLARRGGNRKNKTNTNSIQPSALQRPTRKTLPLHVVRLLEVLPWDPRTKQHVFATEEIFEWQVYREGAWQSHLKHFPTQFKTLHVVKASSKQTSTTNSDNNDGIPDHQQSDTKKDRSFLFFLAGGEIPSSNNTHTSAIAMSRRKAEHRILTDERVTVLFDTDAGYPLPQNDGGVWEWLGSWRVGKHEPPRDKKQHIASTTEAELEAQKRADCDEQGWSYVVEPQDFLLGLPDMIWDNPGGGDEAALLTAAATNATASNKNNSKGNSTAVVKRTFRRRRWIRQRILVDYLYASEGTRQYLELLKENARLSGAASKISDQLVETKAALTESEEKLMQARDALRQKDAALKAAGIITEENTFDDDTDDENMLQLQQQWRQWKQQQDQHDHSENTESDSNLQTSYSLAPEMIRTMSKDGGAFGSKITQWVQQAARKTSEDLTSNDDESEEASNNGSGHGASSASVDSQQHPSSSADKFDWKNIGRGKFMNKLKSPNRSSNLTSQLKKSPSGRSIFRKADSLSPRAGEPALQTATTDDLELL